MLLVILMALSCFSCKGNEVGAGYKDKSVVLKAAGEKITADEYRYFYLNYKNTDPNATAKELHELCIDAIASDIAITLLAKEYDISLTEEEKESLDTYIQGLMDEKGGEEGYYDYLSENNLTGDLFRHLYSQKLLETKVREYMSNEYNNIIKSDDKSFEADLSKNFMAAKQIFISKDTENAAELAESLYSRVEKGEDFDALMREYSEDEESHFEYGFYFTGGYTSVPEFEEAVASLKEGELYKGVLETDLGYHIIMRVPQNKDYTDSHYEELREMYIARRCNEIITEKAESIEFKKTKKFDAINLD